MFEVTAPSGSGFVVANKSEQKQFEDLVGRYTTDNHFTNVSDLQDLDRVIMLEVLLFRYTIWLSAEVNYDNEPIDSNDLKNRVKEFSSETRQLKKALSLDKESRDKDKGAHVADYIANLTARAKEFGVTRNLQALEAITLWKELSALITLHENCDEIERREQKANVEDIFEWITDDAIPRFNQIDLEFRERQRYWIREQ